MEADWSDGVLLGIEVLLLIHFSSPFIVSVRSVFLGVGIFDASLRLRVCGFFAHA